jgi:hypothetical protein
MKVTFTWDKNSVLLDLAGETPAENALLTHFQEEHVAILCPGDFQCDGVRVFIRCEARFEYRQPIEDELGRKGKLERRKKAKAR